MWMIYRGRTHFCVAAIMPVRYLGIMQSEFWQDLSLRSILRHNDGYVSLLRGITMGTAVLSARETTCAACNLSAQLAGHGAVHVQAGMSVSAVKVP